MFDYFWCSKENVPEGVGFRLFDMTHMLWLAFAAALCFFVCRAYKNMQPEARSKCRLAVALLMVADELFKHAVLVAGGAWALNYLPLHLCSFSIFISLWHAIKPCRTNTELLYALSLPGALAALFCANWTVLPCMNALHIHSFTVHILLVLYPLMLLVGGDLRPNYKNLPRCLAFLVVTALPLYFINKAWNANFMFLNWADAGNPLSFFEKLWGTPGYIAGYVPLLAVVWAAMYAPWIIADRKNAKTQKHNTNLSGL